MKDAWVGVEVAEMWLVIVVVVIQQAEAEMVRLGGDEVDDDRVFALLLRIGRGVDPVLGCSMRCGGKRIGIEQSNTIGAQCDTALPSTEVVVGTCHTRVRVHQLHRSAVEDVRSKQLAEIASPHQRRRYHLLREVIVVIACPLLSNEEEELLAVLIEVTGNIERPVQVPAELVVVEALPLGIRIIAGPGVGVQGGVAEIFEGTTVEVAGAALGNHANLAARSAAVLSRVAGGQYLNL